MTTIVTSETLRLVRLALYQLRQDVGVPESVAAAADDNSVVWTKCKDCFDQAFAEVLNAHNWTWRRGVVIPERTDEDDPPIPPTVLEAPDGWPEDVKNALVYATARELAVPVAGRVEDMKNVHSLYEQKIHDARVHDLDAELAAVTDPDMKEVLAAVCPTITTGGAALPMDLVAVTRRVEANRDHARAEIMAAHNWSFCRDEMQVESCVCSAGEIGYPFSCELPAKCVRPLECYDQTGRPADWKIVGRQIRSVFPIVNILYIRNEERLDRWPPLVRSAYVSLLASDIAATVAGSSAEAQRLRQLYERDLETAKLSDSRGTGSRREERGRNFYADAMMMGSHGLGRGEIWWR